jgi:hypothetical protein
MTTTITFDFDASAFGALRLARKSHRPIEKGRLSLA